MRAELADRAPHSQSPMRTHAELRTLRWYLLMRSSACSFAVAIQLEVPGQALKPHAEAARSAPLCQERRGLGLGWMVSARDRCKVIAVGVAGTA